MVIRISIGVVALAASLAAGSDAAPGAGGDRAAQFPVNRWVSLDGVLKLELMPGAEGRYRFMNWYGGVAWRSKTGEVIALDGFVGQRRMLILARHVQRNGPHWLAMRLDLDALPEWTSLPPPSD